MARRDVLVPIVSCDFLLTAFDLQLFEPIVSSTVLDEVERTLIEEFPRLDPGVLLRRVEQMRDALADQTVDTEVVDGVPDTINAKDRHVVAAALAAEAIVVVTNDDALRSEIAASGLDLEPLNGDAFVMRLWGSVICGGRRGGRRSDRKASPTTGNPDGDGRTAPTSFPHDDRCVARLPKRATSLRFVTCSVRGRNTTVTRG